MPAAQSAPEILDREYLIARAKIIELAAFLDRLDRATPADGVDSRLADVRRGLQILAGDGSDRAERVQMVFSLPHDENWQQS